MERLLDQTEEAIDQLDWETVHDCAKAVLVLESENSDARAFPASAQEVLGSDTDTVVAGKHEAVVCESITPDQPTSCQRPLRGLRRSPRSWACAP